MQDEKQQKKPEPQLNPGRFKEHQYANTNFIVEAEPDTKPEQVLDTAYWSHVAVNLRPFDRIDVHAEDGAWWMELLVVAATRNWAKVVVVQRLDLADADPVPIQVEGYEVKWRGPKKFAILRLKDGQVIEENIATRDLAHQLLEQFTKKVA